MSDSKIVDKFFYDFEKVIDVAFTELSLDEYVDFIRKVADLSNHEVHMFNGEDPTLAHDEDDFIL